MVPSVPPEVGTGRLYRQGCHRRRLRRRRFGVGLLPPEAKDFTSAYLRSFAEVADAASGGDSEASIRVKTCRFSQLQNFSRRLGGVPPVLAPDDCRTENRR